MKFGYSILLGEIIESDKLNYQDCKNFQIICPNCKEPIFKVKRNSDAINTLHYLSHYEKDKAYQSECELRVGNLSTSNIKLQNTIARNQKLTYFLKVLQDAILHKYYGPPYTITDGLKQVNNSANIKALRNFYFKNVIKYSILKDKEDFDLSADDYINEMIKLSDEFEKTTFSIDNQKRIAFDIWSYIFTPKGKPNFNFVFNHSFVYLIVRGSKRLDAKDLNDWEKYLFESMLDLIELNEDEGKRILENMKNYILKPPFVGEPSSLLFKMITEIAHEMVGTLISLPYFEILMQNRTNN